MTRQPQPSSTDAPFTGMNRHGHQTSLLHLDCKFSYSTIQNIKESSIRCTPRTGWLEASGETKNICYCCTTLDVGTRHECQCQLKIWYNILQPHLTQQWRAFYTESSINISHTSRQPEIAFWWTIGPKDIATYDWSLTPWNYTLQLPPLSLRAIWFEVVQEYRHHHHR